ncbi:putative metal-dependent hydrolase [Cupriavidus gilardii J11]|uniref:Putative metal-dependent hydrolase n=1 Tax=Cupriavidus gilardii J11 TaxID=936133 RepID=A0A562BK46_9BURK|nr:cyclase family protein [Cupriavidus gilardii]TWG85628.1 putative metal-dependent hydrolase [Cupriavidus gilardii J11]
MAKRWKRRPEGSTWGDFGEDDQLGRLNLLTPEKVKAGISEVREGLSFCLSLPLDYPGGAVLNPRRHPPRLSPTLQDGCPCLNFPLARLDARNTDVLSDDQVTLALQYSTQWDSFAHVGAFFDVMGNGVKEKVYYNGYRANEHIVGPRDYRADGDVQVEGPHGARALGVENMARKAIQGRAVLVDLKKHFGLSRHSVGYDDLMRVLDADRIDIAPGDMLVLRTGFTEVLMQMNRQPDIDVLNRTAAVLDGRDDRLLQWITSSGVAAICADNYAVEGLPAAESTLGQRPALPLHQHCLFKLGVPLAELWWLTELADWLHAHGRSAFLLTAPPLNLPGAVGSPVTPVATV